MTLTSAETSVTRQWPGARLLLAGAIGVLLAAAAAPTGASAGEPRAPFLEEAGLAKPTRAWVRFCADSPAECAVDESEQEVIPYSKRLWYDLVDVNIRVNRSVEAVTDIAKWGVSDRWDYPVDGRGDCEDIQLEKRRQLIARGYPGRAIRMAVVINSEGEGHAVLVVRTEKGDYVLDNRIDAVLPWYEANYAWVKREGKDARGWVALGGPKAAVETAGNAD